MTLNPFTPPRRPIGTRHFYAREQRAIFWDQWFYAGRARRLASAGAFRVLDVAGESVILIRAEDGSVRAR